MVSKLKMTLILHHLYTEAEFKEWSRLLVPFQDHGAKPIAIKLWRQFDDNNPNDKAKYQDFVNCIFAIFSHGTMLDLESFLETNCESRLKILRTIDWFVNFDWAELHFRPLMLFYLLRNSIPVPLEWTEVTGILVDHCTGLGMKRWSIDVLSRFLLHHYNLGHPRDTRTEVQLFSSLFCDDGPNDENLICDDLAGRCLEENFFPSEELLQWLYEKAAKPKLTAREVFQFVICEGYELGYGDMEIKNKRIVNHNDKVYSFGDFPVTFKMVGEEAMRDAIERLCPLHEEMEQIKLA